MVLVDLFFLFLCLLFGIGYLFNLLWFFIDSFDAEIDEEEFLDDI